MSSLVVSADRVSTARGVLGDAIRIEQDTIVAVGRRSDLGSGADQEQHYPGATLVPGIRDAHLHPVPYAAALGGISLKTAVDLADVQRRLRRGQAARPDQPLVAMRLDDETLAEHRLPTRQDLDQAVTNDAVLAHRYCGHVAVANTAALTLAGIDAATPDPVGGTIDRDAAGNPTGILRETAIEIVTKALAGSNPLEPQAVLAALSGLVGLGITSIGAMVRPGDGPWASLGDEVDVLCQIADDLPLTLHAYVIADTARDLRAASQAMRAAGPRLNWRGLKRFADGSLGGHTAAMWEPFSDAMSTRGTLRLGALDAALARTSIDLGGSVAIHAIGDRACAEVVDLFEELIESGADSAALRLEHASVLAPADIQRMAELGVVASVQPAFLGSEAGWLETRVGAERIRTTYAFQSLLRSGVIVAAGSDCPVEPPNPWPAMALARDRAGLVIEESVSAAAALGMFTDGAARALGEPVPLEPGSPADFVVVDRDPLTVPPDELRDLEVLETFVAGESFEVDRTTSTWND